MPIRTIALHTTECKTLYTLIKRKETTPASEEYTYIHINFKKPTTTTKQDLHEKVTTKKQRLTFLSIDQQYFY